MCVYFRDMSSMVSLFAISIILPASLLASATIVGVNDEVVKEGEQGSPGAKFGFSKKFAVYANEVFMETLEYMAPRLQISDVTFRTRENFLKFTSLKVVNFKTPNGSSIDFHSPNRLQMNLRNLTVEISGKFETKYNGLSASGLFDSTAADVDVSAAMEMNQSSYGRLRVSSSGCSAKIGEFDLQVHRAGIFEQIFKALKFFLVGYIKANVEEKICHELKKFVNEFLDRKLEDIPTKVFLSSFFPSRTQNALKNNSLKNFQEIFENLVLDYSLISIPTVTNESFNLHIKSEVSLDGGGNTPFFPAHIDDHCESSMICLSISDYVINSFLWHAYRRGSLNFDVENLKIRNLDYIFDTSCDDQQEICLSLVLKEIQKSFAGYDFKLTIQPIEAPAIIIESDKAVVMTKSYANLIASDEKSSLPVVKTEFSADARFSPYLREDNMIYANFSIEKFHLKLIRTSELISLNDTVMEVFGRFMKRIIEENLNKFLTNGIRTPKLKEIRFVDSNFKLSNRHLKIQTDVEVVKSDLQSLIADALKVDDKSF